MTSNYKNLLENEYSKTANLKYRRALGQFFTPFEIAQFMSEWVLENQKKTITVLDPAAGFGIFPRAISLINKNKDIKFDLWEIDRKIADKLMEVTDTLGIKADIHNSNFLKSTWSNKYDAVIANPPYFKHHHIDQKEKIFHDICQKTDFLFNIKASVYCWFLIKSMNLLNDNGRLAFIVPAEFLNTNYGEKIKEYLKQSGIVLHFINIEFEKNLFDNVLTTSVIILAKKGTSKHTSINFYNVHEVGELSDLKTFLVNHPRNTLQLASLNPKVKWRNYFNGNLEDLSEKLVPLSTFGKFSRGIATGANKYFVLSQSEVIKHRLSKKCLEPCITRASYVKDSYFDDDRFNELLKQNKKVYLFNGIKADDQNSRDYIELGEKQNIHRKYLTSNRNPWYATEKRKTSRIWASVFERNGLKFVWNGSSCKNLTCFHGFYPTEEGRKYLEILYIYLNSNTSKRMLEREKRQYGGGLGKFEPNDLNKALVVDFRLLSKQQIGSLKKLQNSFLKSDNKKRSEILKAADQIFKPLAQ